MFSSFCSLYLRHRVKLDHSSSKRLSIGTQRGNEAQHSTVECSINLGERGWAWIVHIHHRYMTQESENNITWSLLGLVICCVSLVVPLSFQVFCN